MVARLPRKRYAFAMAPLLEHVHSLSNHHDLIDVIGLLYGVFLGYRAFRADLLAHDLPPDGTTQRFKLFFDAIDRATVHICCAWVGWALVSSIVFGDLSIRLNSIYGIAILIVGAMGLSGYLGRIAISILKRCGVEI